MDLNLMILKPTRRQVNKWMAQAFSSGDFKMIEGYLNSLHKLDPSGSIDRMLEASAAR